MVELIAIRDNKEESVKRSVEKPSQLSQERKIISARQIQKLAKNDSPIFLLYEQRMIIPKERKYEAIKVPLTVRGSLLLPTT